MYHPRHNDTLFFGSILSFLVGILTRSFVSIPLWMYVIFLGIAIISAIISRSQKIISFCIIIFSFLFVLACLRFDIKDSQQIVVKNILESEQKIIQEVVVISEPEYQESRQRFVVKTLEKPSYKILVSADRYPQMYYGDRIQIEGKLRKPQNFETDTGREFDYESYLSKDEIYYTMSFARLTLLESGFKKGLRGILFSIKNSFLGAVERVTPDPESALLGGILLGVKQSLGEDLKQSFIRTGTIHIVVLSGYNVTIVSEAIVRTLQKFLPNKIALSFGGLGIFLFALITGATTTTVRASIMGILGLFARITGRTADSIRMLFLAGFLMVLHNPYTLVFDISFQLSFIATFGLVLISPIILSWKWIHWFTPKWGIREIVASTLATQIAVLPFLSYKIGTLSVISPLANILVLPLIPLSMGVGFLSGLVELFFNIGSNPISWMSFGLLRYIVWTVEKLASISWSALSVPQFHWIIVVVLYIVIGIWMYRFHCKKNKYI